MRKLKAKTIARRIQEIEDERRDNDSRHQLMVEHLDDAEEEVRRGCPHTDVRLYTLGGLRPGCECNICGAHAGTVEELGEEYGGLANG